MCKGCESGVSGKRALNKKLYRGVGVEVKKYERFIRDVFFDESLFNELLVKPKHSESYRVESLDDAFNLYLMSVMGKVDSKFGAVQSIILLSHLKGTKRVMNKKGELVVKGGEVKDKRGVEEIVARQKIYLSRLAQAQSLKVMNVIAQGRDEGLSVNSIVERIRGEVKELTVNRARMISRTEIVRSHNRGQVDVMREAGITKYEWITGRDEAVCPICESFDGKLFEVEIAGSFNHPLPVQNTHPNCRCSVVVVE